jgi:hypothetical protein
MLAKVPLPVGCIIYWSGAIGDIPSNFHLCDGTHGTPDLRNRFVPCAGGTKYAVGDLGGSETLDIPEHSHGLGTITGQKETHISPPVHTHQLTMTVDAGGNSNISNDGIGSVVQLAAPSHGHPGQTQTTHTGSTAYPDVEHPHALSGELVAAAAESVPKLPDYYALAFIMRIR